jgi:hypothetical protein
MSEKGADVTLAAAAVSRQLYRGKTHALGHPSSVVGLKAAGVCHSYPIYIEQHV